jgi:adenylate cyclase class IV
MAKMKEKSDSTNQTTEKEIKLLVSDMAMLLNNIRTVAEYSRTEYIRDVIYGQKSDKKKIRLRICDNFENVHVDATHKYRVSISGDVKKEIEEVVYHGSNIKDALAMIELQGDFVEENSYEKIRTIFYEKGGTEIDVDVYPFGALIEIEGEEERIHEIAKRLGYSKKDYVLDSADDLYLAWIKQHSLPEMWDVRFGLKGKK